MFQIIYFETDGPCAYPVSINIKIWWLKLKSIARLRVSLFRLQLKECGNTVNINMGSHYKGGVITLHSRKLPNTHEWQGNCVRMGLEPGADLGLVLLSKWRSRISFLWNVKQAKKRLISGLIQSKSFCIFLSRFWRANFPVISTVKLLFRSMSFEVDCRSVKVFRVEFLTLKHPI